MRARRINNGKTHLNIFFVFGIQPNEKRKNKIFGGVQYSQKKKMKKVCCCSCTAYGFLSKKKKLYKAKVRNFKQCSLFSHLPPPKSYYYYLLRQVVWVITIRHQQSRFNSAKRSYISVWAISPNLARRSCDTK